MGATDTELARFFGISRSTFYLWCLNYPEFSDALRAGKMPADDRVERSLYERAIGYDHESVKTVEEHAFGEDGKPTLVKRTTTTQTQHVLGDVGAQKSWLTNRKPKQWRDRVDVTIDPDENKTSAELRLEMLQFLVDNGVKLKLPPTIEGKLVKTIGVARIAHLRQRQYSSD